jgi:3-deoxy-D-manno-octulosonic acid kinase
MASLSIPAGFVEQRVGNTLWWVKAGWEGRLLAATFSQDHLSVRQAASRKPQAASVIRAGRGAVQRVELNPGETLIIRPYRRGGVVRHVIHDLYWDRPFRPLAELSCTEEARQRGVPTVEVLGARVEWRLGPLYRGLFVTREAAGFHNLWDWLQITPSGAVRRATLSAVAQAIAAMHHAGIAHADLNPTNILVCTESDQPQALLLDFDRARLFPGPVPSALQEANLRRLQRYCGKYDVLGARLSPSEFEQFRREHYAALALKQ